MRRKNLFIRVVAVLFAFAFWSKDARLSGFYYNRYPCSNATGYAKYRRRAQDAVIRGDDAVGNVLEMQRAQR